MSAHTPGPWHFLDWGGRIVDDSVGSSQVLIATVALNTRGDESRHNARLIAAAPELHEVADELFSIVAEERECYLESHRNQATGEVPDVCMPYLERLDAALNKARAVFAKATQP